MSLKEISDVKAYLFLETDRPITAVDIRSIRNQRSQINKRLAAHEVFDVGSTKIFECLREPLKHSRRFEWAIATILHFCGFQTELMGIERGQVPDILAYYQEEDALIIGECTVGVPDENKILKLTERAKRLSSVSERVQAVIFLNVNREMLKEIAIPSDIIIIDKEEIREILNKASRGSSVREIYYQHFSPQYMSI